MLKKKTLDKFLDNLLPFYIYNIDTLLKDSNIQLISNIHSIFIDSLNELSELHYEINHLQSSDLNVNYETPQFIKDPINYQFKKLSVLTLMSEIVIY